MLNKKFFWNNGSKEFLIRWEKGDNLSKISKKTDIQYTHLYNICKSLVSLELIVRDEKQGREKTVILTEKGKRVREHLQEIEKILEVKNENNSQGN